MLAKNLDPLKLKDMTLEDAELYIKNNVIDKYEIRRQEEGGYVQLTPKESDTTLIILRHKRNSNIVYWVEVY